MSIAVIKDSQIVYNRVFGVSDVRTGEPAAEDTLFQAASLTKPVLAYTAFKLVEEGKMELDKPLFKYLEYNAIKHDERYKLITPRIVLMHATGFPNWRRGNKDGKLDIKFTPGEKFSYSGEGYVYLQRVIEKIEGKNLEDIVRENVFIPLKMTNSSLILTDVKRSAAGHTADMQARKKRPWKNANGAASMHTTAKDYAAFMTAILSHKGISEMLTPQIPISDEDNTLSWGLGFGLQKTGDDIYFWHWGDNGSFKTYTVASKNKKTGIVYFTNSQNGLSLVKEIVQRILGKEFTGYSWLSYPLVDGPVMALRKMILDKGLDAGLKKYNQWKAEQPDIFKEQVLNSIGYYLMGKKKMLEAIEIFKLNVTAYPESFNVYDSLGEAYMKNGNKELAIKNYQKSVAINPDNRGGIEALKKLKGAGK
jgi:CubicO group peptidase (beta-lactamase class C family)